MPVDKSLIDETDLAILALLQANARIANADIARQVGMAPSAILDRVRKLEARGIIQGYEARLSPQAMGLDLVAFVFVRTEERVGGIETGELLARIPEVQEVHHVAGEDCYLVKVRVESPSALGRLLRDRFGNIDTVLNTRSTIVLDTVKESGRLPLDVGKNAGET